MLIFYAMPCPAYRLARTWQIALDYELSRDALPAVLSDKIWAGYPPLARS